MSEPWPELMKLIRDETRLLKLFLGEPEESLKNVIAFPATRVVRFPIERTRARGEL